jgi:hypothetical protein
VLTPEHGMRTARCARREILNREHLAIRVASVLAGGVLGVLALLSLPSVTSADGGAAEPIDQAACQGQGTAGQDCRTKKPAGGTPIEPTATSTVTGPEASAPNNGAAAPSNASSGNTNVTRAEGSSGARDATAKPHPSTAQPDTISGTTIAASGNTGRAASARVSTPTAGGGPADVTQTDAKQAAAPVSGDTAKGTSTGNTANRAQAVGTETTQRELVPARQATAPATTPEAKLEVVAEVEVTSTQSKTADGAQAAVTDTTQMESASARQATAPTTTPGAAIEVVAEVQVASAESNLSAEVGAGFVNVDTEVDVMIGDPLEETRQEDIVDAVQPAADAAPGVIHAASEPVPVSTPSASSAGTPVVEGLSEIALVPARPASGDLVDTVDSFVQQDLHGGLIATAQTVAHEVSGSLNHESASLDGQATSSANPTAADPSNATSSASEVEDAGGDSAQAGSGVNALEAGPAEIIDDGLAWYLASPLPPDERSDEAAQAASDAVTPDTWPDLERWVAAVGPPSGPALYGLLLAAALVMATIAVFRGLLPSITRSAAGFDPGNGASAAPAAVPPDRQGAVMSSAQGDDTSDQTATGGTQ